MKESKGMKVFTACALGAFIGSLVALSLKPFFWWLGLIAGFGIGYLFYEYKTVGQAVAKAWRESRDLELGKAFCQRINFASLVFGTVFSAMMTLTIGIVSGLILVGYPRGDIDLNGAFLVSAAYGCAGFSLFAAILLGAGALIESPPKDFARDTKELFLVSNPISVYFYFLPKGVYHLAVKTPAIARGIGKLACAIGRFVKRVFILIHSDVRLICGLDAAIGAAIGYFAGNALIGAISGGLIGLVNYRVVSIGWLKLKV